MGQKKATQGKLAGAGDEQRTHDVDRHERLETAVPGAPLREVEEVMDGAPGEAARAGM